MKYSLIKWFGTIIIILAGIFIAANYTYNSWKVTEDKIYTLHLSEYVFALKDGEHLRIKMSFVFMDKQVAGDVAEKKAEIINALSNYFSSVESTKVYTDDVHLEELKTQVLLTLKTAKYPIQSVSFDAPPRLL